MPPYASYPPPSEQNEPLPCAIIGRNDKRMAGRMTFFVPEQSIAYVQMPPSRTTLGLRFDQFKSLTLTTPVLPDLPAEADPHAGIVGHRATSTCRVQFAKGNEYSGETVGHVEDEYGLYLFPPRGSDGGVERMFIPRAAYTGYEIGPRIGDVLVEQQAATPQQVEQAVDAQNELRSQKLGDILVTKQLVSPEQLLAAIERQAKMPMVRIGEALSSLGMVTEAQLQEALAQQQADRGVPLGELLVKMGVVSREDLQVALARKMGYPLVNVDVFPIEPEALKRLAYTVALRLQVVPLLMRDGRLIVALDDPARRRAAVDEIEFITQMKVVPVLAQSASVEALLFKIYDQLGAVPSQRMMLDPAVPINFDIPVSTDKLVETLEKEDLEKLRDDDKPIEQSDNSLVRLINNMIIEAHKDGVSDIHVESYPGREKIRIRFRKDGLLRTHLELPSNYRAAVIARIKIMCDLDISEKRKPQDGKINFAKFSPAHKIELRIATIPTNSGLEDVVMRILASAKPIPIDNLGITPANLSNLKHAIERPYGLVLCVGPTGSGKTTTLHSALSHINVPERKIWTAEDPVEITQPGLRQVQVNPKIEWTFARALRAFLRADPDVIMVGEIRDEETASMAVEASLTGHLVLSTLHTNSAPETVTRLLDMGLDPFNFGDSLLAVLAQRLVRRLCMECRTSRPASDEEVDELLTDYMHAFGHGEPPESRDAVLANWKQRHSRDGRLMAFRSPGCKVCDESGFKGRVGVHELMTISRELRRLIQTGGRAEQIGATAMSEGMRTLRQDGIVKVLAGATTIEEVRSTSNV
ncbi:MAG: Flp pilus assembly complex ATPase component TadA [Proteobacteria bacterium]|nr:Flp pilus assembly complex ATPase component TadA [Pseudomonadota bacterium]